MAGLRRGDRLVLVGPLPPPLHGFAAINAALGAALQSAALDIEALDLSPGRRPDQAGYRMARIRAWLNAVVRYAVLSVGRRSRRLYIAVSGGRGQVFDLPFIALARLTSQDVVVHHHSFAYLNRRSRLMAALTWLAGPGALHVVLCEAMALQFQRLYGPDRQVLRLSNTALLAPGDGSIGTHDTLATIGLISNLSLDKGVGVFIDLLARLRGEGCRVRGRLAGPAADKATRVRIEAAVQEALLEWCGPVYGPDKDVFFAGIDALVFPTQYVNEAEPLVIHEALQRSLPVIATDRGCIAGLVGDAGLVLDAEASDLTAAVELIRTWSQAPQAYAAARTAARQRFDAVAIDAHQARAIFLARLGSGIAVLRSHESVGPTPELDY